jgi:hypothetical protein
MFKDDHTKGIIFGIFHGDTYDRFLLPPNYVCMRTCMYVYMYVPMDLCVSTFFWGVKFGLNPKRKYKREYSVAIFLIFWKVAKFWKKKKKRNLPYLDFDFSLVRIF